ncbi:efflux RND transporter periplasmic adaptor subunit [Algicola sagamiensis]|uniref:efflux RND transporter periplasmic adaptor subunit n=1 Tax=Algicola sagamiensis TaxID=163869 RepID=UPI000370EF28|nr:efflux RND transporter periplasmic adaptor subunit [Algicola sagamiensis]
MMRQTPITKTFIFLLSLFVTEVSAQSQSKTLPSVIVKKVKLQDVTPSFEYVGRVEAQNKVDILPRVSGYLAKRHFQEGAMVEKGTLLFDIEPDTYEIKVKQRQADLASAKASLKKAKADLKRQKNLKKRGAASQADLDQAEANELIAQANVLKAEAELKSAELDLSYTKLYAPITGRISRSQYSPGNLVSSTSKPLATMTSMHPIYVNMPISEKVMIEARRKGIDLKNPPVAPTLKLSDGTFYQQKGEFDYIDTSVNISTDTILVRAVFPNEKEILLPGEFVQVVVTSKEKIMRPSIPQSAVQKDQQGYFVLVVESDNTVKTRRIDVGPQHEGQWAIDSGLKEGEKIIVEGLQKVRPGSQVNPVEAK